MARSLRPFLRAETRGAHDRVDAVFDGFDLTSVRSYGDFLSAHLEALTSLPLSAAPAGLPPLGLVPLLRDDLRALGRAAAEGAASDGAASDGAASGDEAAALGAYYVVTGSRLGAQILQARWRDATDRRVRAAGRYLGDTASLEGWKALNALLCGTAPPDPDAVLRGALAAFSRFEAAGRRWADGRIGAA